MRRSVLFTFFVTAALFAVVACDSTLNLSDGDGGAGANVDGGNGGGDSSCPGVCDKFIACGFGESAKREACISDCTRGAPKPLLDCVARTSCAEMQRVCAAYLPEIGIPGFDSAPDDGFEVGNCQSGCDSIQFFDCLSASEHKTCRDLCASAPASKRDSFRGCASGAGSNCTKAHDCFGVFVGD